jgi:hypothetical protein
MVASLETKQSPTNHDEVSQNELFKRRPDDFQGRRRSVTGTAEGETGAHRNSASLA